MGKKLGQLLRPGDLVCLNGDLGAGKTTFIKGLALGLGCKDIVTSPTFVLMNVYTGRVTLYHIDLYRITANELATIGLEDCLNGNAVTAVEWSEKGVNFLPKERLNIKITAVSDNSRKFTIISHGQRYKTLIESALLK